MKKEKRIYTVLPVEPLFYTRVCSPYEIYLLTLNGCFSVRVYTYVRVASTCTQHFLVLSHIRWSLDRLFSFSFGRECEDTEND